MNKIPLVLLTCIVASFSSLPGEAAPLVLEQELQHALAAHPGQSVEIVASFTDQRARDRAIRDLTAYRFASIPALAMTASPKQVARLARAPGVSHIERTGVIPLLMRTATTATRAKDVWSGADTIEVGGRVVDGHGVGVAVVDSGISGTHPDLAPNLVKNFKVASDRLAAGVLRRVPVYTGPNDVLVPADETDTTSGHGTHVAGIVAGTGAASQGGLRGSAPGASLYGFGIGEGLNVIEQHVLAAFDWIAVNHATQDPPIRVVNNSWGSLGSFRPDSAITRLTTAMVQEGLAVVWAAGNGDLTGDGGDCTTDRTMSESKHPGVIKVAAFDDGEVGQRDGTLAGFSSRGSKEDPQTWPDLSAPGWRITSAMAPSGGLSWLFKSVDVFLGAISLETDPNSDAYSPYYVTFDGTSMAAPHVAGIVALMLQARPDLTNTQVEQILENTAHPFTFGAAYEPDPANPTSLSSCDKGHGLADAWSAVEAAIAAG